MLPLLIVSRYNEPTLSTVPIYRQVARREALLRWRHPELGLVPPADFIPILEQSGLIEEVGLWVLNTACREARAWRRRGSMTFPGTARSSWAGSQQRRVGR